MTCETVMTVVTAVTVVTSETVVMVVTGETVNCDNSPFSVTQKNVKH